MSGMNDLRRAGQRIPSDPRTVIERDKIIRANAVREFTEAVLHGNEVHRAWLRQACESFVAGVAILPEETE